MFPRPSILRCTNLLPWMLCASLWGCEGGKVVNQVEGEVDTGCEDAGSGAQAWYADSDGDGYGDPGSTVLSFCTDLSGYVLDGTDCDDTNADTHPGAVDQAYDGVDTDCDEASDYDVDGDGYDSAEYGGDDCFDQDPTVYPGADETWYDGVDSDCDEASDYDADGDGHDHADHDGDDCDDGDADIHPDATDTWYDGIDADCDGSNDYDADRDGVVQDDDCDDLDPQTTECLTSISGGGGCSMAGRSTPTSALWLLALAMLRRRRQRAVGAAIAVIGSIGGHGAMAADGSGPNLSATGPDALLGSPSADVGEAGRLDLALSMHHADQTLEGTWSDGTSETLIGGLKTLDLGVGWTPAPKARLEVMVPLHSASTLDDARLLGDVLLAVQGQLRSNEMSHELPDRDGEEDSSGQTQGGLDLATRLVFRLPTGDSAHYLGTGTPSLDVLAIGGGTWMGLDINGALGPSLGPSSTLAGLELGRALVVNLGVKRAILSHGQVGTELLTRQGLATSLFDDSSDQPTELLTHVGWSFDTFEVAGGFGVGLIDGIGSPRTRMVLNLRQSWEGMRRAPPEVAPPPEIDANDPDGDGFDLSADLCPRAAGTVLGCPDGDDDQVMDAEDQCPDDKEDIDRVEDSDGCPETDVDNDGIDDPLDSCPFEPEDIDSVEDGDGCPEEDIDGDGVPDADDFCPLLPGNADKPRPYTGCP
ncbi:MAG: MopE-related protein [Myxococcota bacterium]|nr:MopE-related protein [Myxococcota bacterium]